MPVKVPTSETDLKVYEDALFEDTPASEQLEGGGLQYRPSLKEIGLWSMNNMIKETKQNPIYGIVQSINVNAGKNNEFEVTLQPATKLLDDGSYNLLEGSQKVKLKQNPSTRRNAPYSKDDRIFQWFAHGDEVTATTKDLLKGTIMMNKPRGSENVTHYFVQYKDGEEIKK